MRLFLKLGFSLSLSFVVSKPPAPLCPHSPRGPRRGRRLASPVPKKCKSCLWASSVCWGGQSQSSSRAGRQAHHAAAPAAACVPPVCSGSRGDSTSKSFSTAILTGFAYVFTAASWPQCVCSMGPRKTRRFQQFCPPLGPKRLKKLWSLPGKLHWHMINSTKHVCIGMTCQYSNTGLIYAGSTFPNAVS